MSLTDRTSIEVIYSGTDITKDISNDLVSFTYTDNESGKADDISISLKDDDDLWAGPWLPTEGDTIECTIITKNDRQGTLRLACGRFTIDELNSSGPPSLFEIAAVSVPIDTGIRKQIRSKSWEEVKLSGIVSSIASEAGLEMLFLASPDPLYDRRDQTDETDLQFINRMCEDEAFALKVTDRQIVVYDTLTQEKEPPIAIINKRGGEVINYRFTGQAYDVFKEVIVEYSDPTTGQLNQYTYTDPNISSTQSFKVVQRAANIAEAERIAKAALRKKNRYKTSGSMTVRGKIDYVTGLTIEINGFGKYDGIYLIEKTTHKVGSGYEVTLDFTQKQE